MKKVAVITGASQGIGEAMATHFAKKGYHLALIARRATKLQTLSETLQQTYPIQCTIHPLDVSDNQAVQAAVNEIIHHHHRIDVLFNNAGISHRGTSDISIEHFEELIKVNLLGAFYILHAVVPQMKQQGHGYIFNLVSRSGVIARPIVGGYAASKFGFRGYSEALYKELAPLGIKVTALHPGWVNSEMTNLVDLPPEKKIQLHDMTNIVDMLLNLSPYAFISDIVIEPQKAVGLAT